MAVLVAPPAPSWSTILGDWSLDVALPFLVGAAALYVVGIRRLDARGRRWSPWRAAAFLSGLAVILFATESGFAQYDRVLFSMHIAQHLLLGMMAPMLLALGAPITLALQAGSRRTQRRLLRVLHSGPVAVLTHPLTAWLLFGGTLVILYFTGLYELSLRNEWVHAAVHVHFVVAGSLFMWHVVGIDPIRRAMGYGAKLLYAFVMLPFHAFLGVALLTTDHVIAAGWYSQVARDWGASALSDQRTGAGLLWVSGEIFGLMMMAIVVYQWMAAEERAAARHDRMLDAREASTESVAPRLGSIGPPG